MATLNKPEDLNFLTYEDRDKFEVDADITTALQGQVYKEKKDGKISPPAFPEVPTPAVEKGPSLSDTLIQYFAPKKQEETGKKFDDFWNKFRVQRKTLTGGPEETFEPMGLPLFNKFLEKEITNDCFLKNITKISKTGVNRISVGSITHSAKSFDSSLLIF